VPTVLKPRQRRADKRPDEILNAAAQCFLECGFAGAKVDHIAAGAGLSKGAVYLYFKSKEEMLHALIERGIKRVARSVADHLDANTGDPVTALKGAIPILAQVLSRPEVFAVPRIVIAEAGNFPEIARTYRDEVIDVAQGALIRLVERGQAAGVFKQMDPLITVRTLIGAVLMQLIWRTTFERPGEKPLDPETFIAGHLDIFLNGLCTPKEMP
jgi:AcrR family transcriptional regulator